MDETDEMDEIALFRGAPDLEEVKTLYYMRGRVLMGKYKGLMFYEVPPDAKLSDLPGTYLLFLRDLSVGASPERKEEAAAELHRRIRKSLDNAAWTQNLKRK